MKKFCVMAALGGLAVSAAAQLAGHIDGEVYKHLDYATGEITDMQPALRFGPAIAWDNSAFHPNFLNLAASPNNNLRADDWGDVQNGTQVNGFRFAVATNASNQNQVAVFFFNNDNGGGTGAGVDEADPNGAEVRQVIAAFSITFTPTAGPSHYFFDIDLEGDPNLPFTVSGPDTDGDGLTDFGYAVQILNRGNATQIGFSNALEGSDPVGADGRTDICTIEAERPVGSGNYTFFQNFDFGPTIFTQLRMRLYAPGAVVDTDNDGVPDSIDNCVNVSNPDQADRDGDGTGDVCDNCPDDNFGSQDDTDNDGRGDGCDNCPETANPGQEDCDNDEIGDACDGDCGCCSAGCPQPGCDDGGIDADFNGDCMVNLSDLATLLANFGGTGGNAQGDTDGTGLVNLADLANTLSRFGADCN